MKLSKEQAKSLANKITQEINLANQKKKDAFLVDRTNKDFLKIIKTERYKTMAKAFDLGVINNVTLSNKIMGGLQSMSIYAIDVATLDKAILQRLYSIKNPKCNYNLYSDIILDDIYIATIESDDIDSVITTIKTKYLN